ncbi:MAG TPA: hypothetical protein VGR54_06545 [Nitrosopumilaceae archaeon]|nr:hypothetical protein [Nitrosopumilaceae archaeon]
MIDTLILVEGNHDIEVLKDSIINLKDAKIITFDFLAHKSLKSLGISHVIIEDYFNSDDEEKIDNEAIELSTGWYKHRDFSILEYDGLNLGSLLETECLVYFFLHLKRILGVKRVLEKERPRKIIGAYLSNFIDSVCKDKVETTLFQSKFSSSLYYDSFEIPVNIGHQTKSIKISRESFMKIKKIVEFITNLFFHFKPDSQEIANKNPILLLDFNPVHYEDMLKALSRNNKILLLNQRRPAIFNLESFRIVKNSKCKIIQLDDHMDPNTSLEIASKVDDLKKKLNMIWSNTKTLEKTFSIEEISFWNAIKEEFIFIISKRFQESIRRLILLQKLFDSIKFKSIIEWSHLGIEDKPVLYVANKKKIPIIFLQHALELLNEKFEKYIPFLTILPSCGAKEAVWGSIMKEYILDHKIKPEEVIEIGSPRHDIFFKRKSRTIYNNTILITISPFVYIKFAAADTKSYEYLEECIKKIIYGIKKISNKKIIIKLHPAKSYYDIKPLIRQIDPSIPIYQHRNIIDLIESCDVMITLNYTTALLEAMILNKPTMLIETEKQSIGEENMFKRGTSIYVPNINEIESKLNDLILNDKIRKELIQKGQEFVNDYFVNHGTASEHLAKILENY